eukprot:scaffold133976_cov51-Attheya_sp.AAC.4
MPFLEESLPLREYPTFGRVATWDEWRAATFQSLPDFLFPWFISNMVGFCLMWIAIKFPQVSRKTWGFLLILASLVNAYVVLTDPTGYIEYGVVAIPPLQHFIYSKFFVYPTVLVLPIAICQGIIGLILLRSQKQWQCISFKPHLCIHYDAVLAIVLLREKRQRFLSCLARPGNYV